MTGADPELFVRRALSDDVEVLKALEHSAREALLEQRGGVRRLAERPPLDDAWAQRVEADDGAVVVAGLDDVVFAWLTVVGPDGDGITVIDSVYVDPGARDLGLGDAMVEWAMNWARERGAASIESWALPGDRDTKNLFERQGLTARLITVSRRLSDPASSADASR